MRQRVRYRVEFVFLNETQIVGGNAARATKTGNVKTGASSQRSEKIIERRGRRVLAAARRRLVGLHGETFEMRVHARAAGKVNEHVHN